MSLKLFSNYFSFFYKKPFAKRFEALYNNSKQGEKEMKKRVKKIEIVEPFFCATIQCPGPKDKPTDWCVQWFWPDSRKQGSLRHCTSRRKAIKILNQVIDDATR